MGISDPAEQDSRTPAMPNAFPEQLSRWEAHAEHIHWEPVPAWRHRSHLESLAQESPSEASSQLERALGEPRGVGTREKPREPSLSNLWRGEDTIRASKYKKLLLPSCPTCSAFPSVHRPFHQAQVTEEGTCPCLHVLVTSGNVMTAPSQALHHI